jgi:hypothetical protein
MNDYFWRLPPFDFAQGKLASLLAMAVNAASLPEALQKREHKRAGTGMGEAGRMLFI